jgi:hypothetical protein
MRYLTAFIIIIVFVSLSCAKSSNPAIPDMERNLSDFVSAIEIFGPSTYTGDFDAYFHDITLAQLCRVGNLWPGEAVEPDHGCIAFTLYREDNDPSTPFKPVFRWLDSDNYDTSESPIFYVCERDDDDPDNMAEYRAIAADAIWNPDGSNLTTYIYDDYIEVNVAYMVKNRPGVMGDIDWDIEVTTMQWFDVHPEYGDPDWWTHEPDNRETVNLLNDSLDQFNPDVAYDHRNADFYVVYSSVDDDDAYDV